MVKNKYCSKNSLRNESDVEQFFLIRLFEDLNYKDSNIKNKRSLKEFEIGRGSKKENYKPDYVIEYKGKPRIVVDAKDPKESIDNYFYQVSGYSLAINQTYDDEKPVRYCILSNGLLFKLYKWDSKKTLSVLRFEDFQDDNKEFEILTNLIGLEKLDIDHEAPHTFEFNKLTITEINKIFSQCHYIIWSKDTKKPVDAFYEFSKLFFVKVYYDRQIHDLIKHGKKPKPEDFIFSVEWIENQEKIRNNDPINTILFSNIKKEYEDKIAKYEKKRIFEKDEVIDITASTIKEVVRKLEHLDLFGIDEDLNGRMFEQFLSATIRGRDLGQFFTPRSAIKLMVKFGDLQIKKNDSITRVLDACCGSGRFLIESMAEYWHQIKNNNSLSQDEKDALQQKVVKEYIYGVDADNKITKIARMNMYLHGDGSNRIYWLNDSLDKKIVIETSNDEWRREAEEFKKRIDAGLKFDVVLTNPPFAKKYKSTDKHQRTILKQYTIAKKPDTDKTYGSVKSNVLFTERYYDLLEDGGKLITIIDDSVLNSQLDKKYRENFIVKNFIVKAVISLPFNSFKNAGTHVKTSILYCRKKKTIEEEQPAIFMAICNNIGHDDFGRETPQRNNVNEVFERYKQFEEKGYIEPITIHNQNKYEVLTCPFQVFSVKPSELEDFANGGRIDAFYYSPELKRIQHKINTMAKSNICEIINNVELNFIEDISKEEFGRDKDTSFKYIEVGNVSKKGDVANYQEDFLLNLPTRARKKVKKGDVIVAKNISSLGNVAIIPEEFDYQYVSTGFIVIRPKNEIEGAMLWGILRSKVITEQMYYLSATAVQPEVSDDIFKQKIMIPIPSKELILNPIQKFLEHSNKANEEFKVLTKELDKLFGET